MDYIEKEMNRTGVDFEGPDPRIDIGENYFYVSPRLGIDYELDEDSLIYANTGLAYKPGGLSNFVDDISLAQFDEERSWSTEIGLKKSWFDDDLRMNVALFYNDIRDYQIERPAGVGINYTIFNAERASTYGAELELQATLWNHWTIEGSLGYTKARFDRYRDPLTGIDLSDSDIPFVPEIDASLAVTYRHPSGFFARVEVQHQGRSYFDDAFDPNTRTRVPDGRRFQEPGYTLLNAAIGYESDGFELSVIGRNLTDEVYYQNIISNIRGGTVGPPTVIGVRARYSF